MRRRVSAVMAWDDPAALAVPVQRVPATLVLADGSRQRVALFAAPGETVESMLTSSRWFLPTADGERIRLFTLSSIACATVAAPPVALDAVAPLVQRAINVQLRSGVVLSGELRYDAPPAQSRTADHLNDPGEMFRLFEGGDIHHVAKAHVQCVTEREDA